MAGVILIAARKKAPSNNPINKDPIKTPDPIRRLYQLRIEHNQYIRNVRKESPPDQNFETYGFLRPLIVSIVFFAIIYSIYRNINVFANRGSSGSIIFVVLQFILLGFATFFLIKESFTRTTFRNVHLWRIFPRIISGVACAYLAESAALLLNATVRDVLSHNVSSFLLGSLLAPIEYFTALLSNNVNTVSQLITIGYLLSFVGIIVFLVAAIYSAICYITYRS